MLVYGTGIPANTTIATITSGTALTLSNNATATGANVGLTFASTFNNDIAGLTVDSITFTSSYVTLSGNQFSLGDPNVSGSGDITVQSGLVNENINMNFVMAGAGSSTQFINVNPGSTLTINGQIAGNTGSQITVDDGGTLVLTANNNAYVGPFQVAANGGIVEVENNQALGGVTTNTVQTLTLNNPVAGTPSSPCPTAVPPPYRSATSEPVPMPPASKRALNSLASISTSERPIGVRDPDQHLHN